MEEPREKTVNAEIPREPDPIVPAEVDLRDFAFTPIFRSRLFGSSFHARTSDAEWRAGVTLWLKSWDQVPAGSLPDDDIDLARLAEFGRDTKTWRKVRAGALHGWFRCSDGRLYHWVVAEGVLEAWQRRRTAIKKGVAGARKRWKSSYSASNGPSSAPPTSANAPAIAGAMPGDSKGQGQGQGRDRDRESKNQEKTKTARPPTDGEAGVRPENAPADGDVDSSEVDAPRGRNGQAPPDLLARIMAVYPKGTGRIDWTQAAHHIGVRLDQGATPDELVEAAGRYYAYVKATGSLETQYVLAPKNFYSGADQPWKQRWDLPKTPEETRERIALHKLVGRRAAMGIPSFREPRAGETAKQYREAQETEWERVKREKPKALDIAALAESKRVPT